MIKNKDRVEILFEKMQGDIKLILEGQDCIVRSVDRNRGSIEENRKTIQAVHHDLKNEIKITALALKDDIKQIENKLDQHLRQPSHA